ncbi:hypothetical protein WJX84_003910 [Apatococcus fuscideae]|uniref:Uncharacterized protein n=1 Tax=Apatococcus fuscideae TaxID=2026836 RepID=A0AAW1RLZ0_9CHLO
MNVLRIGQELASRGHTFVWPISDSHQASHRLLERNTFERLEVVTYKAVEEKVTTNTLSRDPMEGVKVLVQLA